MANRNYHRAGLLMKIALIIGLADLMFIHPFPALGMGVIAVAAIMYFFYLSAHFVQIGKRWMKYPVLIYTITSLGLGILSVYSTMTISSEQTNRAGLINIFFAIGPIALHAWATVLVFRTSHETDVSESTETDSVD